MSSSAPLSSSTAQLNPICYFKDGSRLIPQMLSSAAGAVISQLFLKANPYAVTSPCLTSYLVKPISNACHMVKPAAASAEPVQQAYSGSFLLSSASEDVLPLRHTLDQLLLNANPFAITSPTFVSYLIEPIINPASYMVIGSEVAPKSVLAETPEPSRSFEVEDVTHEEYQG